MQLDRLLERVGAAVVQEVVREAQADERLRPELGRLRAAQADVRQIRTHVVEEKVGVGEKPFPIEGTHGISSRTKRREMARSASDAIEEMTSRSGGPALPQGRRRGKEAHEVVREIQRPLVDLGLGDGIDSRGNRVPADRFLGLNSSSAGTNAFRPNRPMRPSANRFTRPEIPSWFLSSGSW